MIDFKSMAKKRRNPIVCVEVLSLAKKKSTRKSNIGKKITEQTSQKCYELRIFPNLFTFHYILESVQAIINSIFTTKVQVQVKVKFNVDELALENYIITVESCV